MISSKPLFSKWDGIFKDAMTTAVAIDRLVHAGPTGPTVPSQREK